MQNELTESEVLKYITDIFSILDKNFDYKVRNKMNYDDILDMLNDLYALFNRYFELNQVGASKLCVKKYIPLLNLMYKIDIKNKVEYEKQLHNAYRIGARTNLEYYFIYREWDDEPINKFFAPRYEIMQGYVHYLEEIVTNPNLRLLIANMPSGFGKTFPEKISEAWAFGVDPTKTVLSLCSNEDVVKGGSRVVLDEIKSDWFGEVFPDMKYDERIHIDDVDADYKEALVQTLNEYYFNKYNTVWKKRFVQNEIPKVVVTGTLWASGDFIALLIANCKKHFKFHKHPKYKYTYVSEDGSTVIIQVPALDYETGLSTCPELKTTKELLLEKQDIEDDLWQTNFQQIPTDPESLFFSYNKLRTYETIPKTEYIGRYATIDATRKSGKDFFSMPILAKVPNGENIDYYLEDCIFTRTATKDMYEEICNKIIENHIVELVIESNVTSELKQNIDMILKQNGVNYCIIREKYNCENKKIRIQDQKGNVLRCIVFPQKNMFGINTDMGKFMENLTLYNDNGRNPNEDSIDSLALATREFIEGSSKPKRVKPIFRPF